MTTKTPLKQSTYRLKPSCLSVEEVLAQSFVIAPTTIPAFNLMAALSGYGTWLSFFIGLIGLVFVSMAMYFLI